MIDDFELSAYDFDLPESLIAQRPAGERQASRMLVLDRESGAVVDRQFTDLVDALSEGDVLVVNNTRVIPARLIGTMRPGGGQAELFLVRRESLGRWIALGRPGKRLRPGRMVDLPGGYTAMVELIDDGGQRLITFAHNGSPFESDEQEAAFVDEIGRMPLPHYIDREEDEDDDKERYQTVFAASRGAVAAPTAGLHFTSDILDLVRAKGVQVVEVTLHVGYGTFEPVRSDDLRTHSVAAELIEVTSEAARAINTARNKGGRVLAVGTTTTRTLESVTDDDGVVHAFRGPTDLTILPGRTFKAVDALLTNFHLPKSSLLVMISAFAGREAVLQAYAHAVQNEYGFYSYGDCMLIT